MSGNSNGKSKRGGARPGAGRKPKAKIDAKAIGRALEHLDTLMAAHDPEFSEEQRRWHVAMLCIGVSPEAMAAALFKPGTSERFRSSIEHAVAIAEADCLPQSRRS